MSDKKYIVALLDERDIHGKSFDTYEEAKEYLGGKYEIYETTKLSKLICLPDSKVNLESSYLIINKIDASETKEIVFGGDPIEVAKIVINEFIVNPKFSKFYIEFYKSFLDGLLENNKQLIS